MSQRQAPGCTYEESCKYLQQVGWLDATAPISTLPLSRPKYDDKTIGVSFFRIRLSDQKLENLTLPRTFFGRSEVQNVSFFGSNLSESTLCWNDFSEVNFAECDLSGSDLRAAIFRNVNFSGTNLDRADLRRSDFIDCDFSNANMAGAKLTGEQRRRLQLSRQQVEQIDWQDSDGEEPGGG